MASLFSQLKKANRFGNFGRRFSDMSDAELYKAYKEGNPDALAEWANRHQNVFGAKMWSRARKTNADPDDTAGSLWLDLDKAAKTFNEGAGANPTTYFDRTAEWNTGKKVNSNMTESERTANYDNILSESDEHGADILNTSRTDIEAENKELKDMVAKLQAELSKIKVGKDGKTGADIMDQYRVADWENAETDMRRRTKALEEGGYDEASPITDSQVARQLGVSQPNFVYQKKSMLDKLPPKLKDEILAKLRGRVKND